ncbi:hypothetical protein LRS05_10800 [Flavobacterium sp. J372]|uniref:hypothetical protein n=1 Tax=Flavobacterium sp. J372 TaxID=2898436 RepID=UPI002150CC2E|nr:hypothetical protein [Flavobacterium sp. J372]MCR5862607.1 hypothetical protein [Flavobacterium sp. J372]
MAITFYDFAFCSTDAGFSRKVQILLSPRKGLNTENQAFPNFTKTHKKMYKTCKINDLQVFLFPCTSPEFIKRHKSSVAKSRQNTAQKNFATRW